MKKAPTFLLLCTLLCACLCIFAQAQTERAVLACSRAASVQRGRRIFRASRAAEKLLKS